ncbi:MAG: methyltransferase [Leptospiraceae bacterium]|nr:methyltransferase [Leptospiraceae bacterium]
MNEEIKNELKSTFVSYWHSLALSAACKLNLFDLIDMGYNDSNSLVAKSNTNTIELMKLLEALLGLGYLNTTNGKYLLTEKGKFLTESHDESLKYACILWSEEHLTAWQNLTYTIQTGKPAFEEIFKDNFFSYLNQNPEQLKKYHNAIEEYARDDYSNINSIYNFQIHRGILEIGSGTGYLIHQICKNTNIQGYTLDLPEVLKIAPDRNNIEKIPGNFFKSIPKIADAILLARVLHDWNDEKARLILRNCAKSLPHNGRLYVIEILREQLKDKANLLNLNMSIVCNSQERTFNEYLSLLSAERFIFMERKQVNSIQSLLVFEKI